MTSPRAPRLRDAFVTKWEPAIRWCAVGIVLRFPDLASDEDDLVQVGRIAVDRHHAMVTRTDNAGFQLREVKQAARNAMFRYLQAWRGWRRPGANPNPTRGPARMRDADEGSDSLVWGVLSVESHERLVLVREEARLAAAALMCLTDAQRQALLADREGTTRDQQRQRAQLRLSARSKLKQLTAA